MEFIVGLVIGGAVVYVCHGWIKEKVEGHLIGSNDESARSKAGKFDRSFSIYAILPDCSSSRGERRRLEEYGSRRHRQVCMV